MNIDSPVDRACVENMKALLEDMYGEVLAEFLRNTQSYIDEISQALAANDRTTAGSVAHKIKSSAGHSGFRELARIAGLLEHPKETPQEMLLAQQAELQDAYHQTTQFLQLHALLE